MVSLYLPSVLILSAFPLRFSQRLLKPRRWWRGRPAVNWLLILGFSAGTKTMAKTNTPRRVAPWFFLFFRCFFFALFCALVGFSPFRSLLFAPYALFLPTVLPFFFFPFPPLLFFLIRLCLAISCPLLVPFPQFSPSFSFLPSPLRSLIFSGFIAREYKPFQTASLYSSNGSWGGRRRRRLTNSKTAPFVWWEYPFSIWSLIFWHHVIRSLDKL